MELSITKIANDIIKEYKPTENWEEASIELLIYDYIGKYLTEILALNDNVNAIKTMILKTLNKN